MSTQYVKELEIGDVVYPIRPLNTMYDGQWVNVGVTIFNTTALGTYNVDISSYLPDDEYTYEIILQLIMYNESSSNRFCSSDITTDGSAKTSVIVVQSSGEVSCREVTLITTDRIVTIENDENASTRYGIYLMMYRRLGTNS